MRLGQHKIGYKERLTSFTSSCLSVTKTYEKIYRFSMDVTWPMKMFYHCLLFVCVRIEQNAVYLSEHNIKEDCNPASSHPLYQQLTLKISLLCRPAYEGDRPEDGSSKHL